jgi:hypothetical protein
MDAADLRQKLSEAATNGEFLTCIYHGGHAPGTKRRLLPLRVLDGRTYAITDRDSTPKTYLLSKISQVADDAPVPWAHDVPDTKGRSIEVDPVVYFARWHYTIRPELFSAFGVVKRDFVDKEKTRVARSAATDRGLHPSHVSRVRIMRRAFSVMPLPLIDFRAGDIFYSDRAPALQVMAIRKFVEIHLIACRTQPRLAYHVSADELVEWLQSGPPDDAEDLRIGPWDSYSTALFDAIEPPPTQSITAGRL